MKRINWPNLVIIILVVILATVNYKSNTYLTGWDNLHPEFNFASNIKRSVFAVWQEYQGLGVLGGMGHAADLLHQLVLFVWSLVIPTHLLRYTWTMLMLALGGLGAYKLAQTILSRGVGTLPPQGRNSFTPRVAALVAGLFYILNLATIQTFYIPFETFTAHFGFLPWILWAAVNWFSKPSKRNLLILAGILLANTPSYYVPTLFVVTCITLVILLGVLAWFEHNSNTATKIAKVFGLVFVVNAFWLLPFLYSTATNSDVVLNNKINQMATETILFENKEFGTLKDVPILKGFWFGKTDLNFDRDFDLLLAPWHTHLASPIILGVGYILFATVMVGAVAAVSSKNPLQIATFVLFALGFIMLTSSTPPFSWFGELFRTIPLFDQAFRFPFTKFSILASLSYALLFAIAIQWLANFARYRKFLSIASYLLPAALLAVYTSPAFRGHLFYQKELLKIPNEYFQLFDFFKKQPAGRIANFPQHTFWGWNYYSWGYGGSGFLWYGIDQSVLDRAFDPWSHKNENYYWEISYALYSQNQSLFEKVLEKYQVTWILVDKNVINPVSPKSLYLDELQEMLLQSNKVQLVKLVGNINIYWVKLNTQQNNSVFLAKNLLGISPDYNWTNLDQAFADNGHYISSDEKYVYYPFRSLFTGKVQSELEFQIADKGDYFEIKHKLPANAVNYKLQIPQEQKELLFVDPADLNKITVINPEVLQIEDEIVVRFPNVAGHFSVTLNPTDDSNVSANTCESTKKEDSLRISSPSGICRISFSLPTLDHRLAYLMRVKSYNKHGLSLVFWIENTNSRKSDVETYLPVSKNPDISYFIQPPMEEGGLGYTLHFDNKTVGRQKGENALGKIEVFPLPFKFLTRLRLKDTESNQPSFKQVEVEHPNQSMYRVKIEPSDQQQTLVLSQSFDPGWSAYKLPGSQGDAPSGLSLRVEDFRAWVAPLLGKKVQNHVLVNNWANGWVIKPDDKETQVILVYLPQYLEYAGFVFLGGLALALALKSRVYSKSGIQNQASC